MAIIEVKWDEVKESDFALLPAGEYPVTIIDIDEKSTKDGDPMWVLKMEVLEGEYAGSKIQDRIAFSPQGMWRVKLVFSRFGHKCVGDEQVQPKMLIGREAFVTVIMSSFIGREGNSIPTNKIPGSGYREVPLPF